MSETWREIASSLGPVPPEAEPLAGDVGLLVPITPEWRVLDLSSGDGGRAAALASWCREAFAVVRDPARLPVLAARVKAQPEGAGRLVGVVAGSRLPFAPGSFDLVVLEGDRPWPLEQVRPLLRAGGWLVWIVEPASMPGVDRRDLNATVASAERLLRWGAGRLTNFRRWQARLADAGCAHARTWVHVREYTWGFLPVDAPEVQRYYLEAIQEEAVGAGEGRAKLARFAGRLRAYPYLVSAYAVVARAQEGAGA